MKVSPTGLSATTVRATKLASAPTSPPAAAVSSTEVLITTQQVVFGTAAALGAPRKSIRGRLAASTRRLFATGTNPPSARSRYYPKHYGFLENALMAREMERL